MYRCSYCHVLSISTTSCCMTFAGIELVEWVLVVLDCR